jgi:hypothetical protein
MSSNIPERRLRAHKEERANSFAESDRWQPKKVLTSGFRVGAATHCDGGFGVGTAQDNII